MLMRTFCYPAVCLIIALAATPAAAQTARTRYDSALKREAEVRAMLSATTDPTPAERADALRQVTRLVSSYEGIVRRFPTSGYSDNALWQGAGLAEAAYRRFGRADDRGTAIKLYQWLSREYPTSPLVRRARTQVVGLESAESIENTLPAASAVATPASARPDPGEPVAVRTAGPSVSAPSVGAPSMASAPRATLQDIQRVVLEGGVRVTLELDREVSYHEERIANPDRVFFDLRGAQLATPLTDKVISYTDDIVKQIRTGRHPNDTVRVVLELEGVARYSVFTLYNPYRVVIDCERSSAVTVPRAAVTAPVRVAAATLDAADVPVSPAVPVAPPPLAPAPAVTSGEAVATPPPPAADAAPAVATPPAATPPAAAAPPAAAPAAPLSNGIGGFSLSRQLGLGVSRIVIDPGHGGRDPGSSAHGIKEADLTLDIALRLEKLLQEESGIEVVLTRRSNVYVPLEERTAIANRESADLFLSIHGNASRNPAANGIETYYLSFASTPDAEAVAARENSASERAMHNLPDIIKAIALNNKLDESRDLAAMIQEAMVTKVRRTNKAVRNLGVKKAPFVVLIGAGMPSVLAEVSFLTNRQESQRLKTSAYKQHLAEALRDAVIKYRSALKRQSTVADRP